jgi:glycosyltransferase involved in cell wall biosynthesis
MRVVSYVLEELAPNQLRTMTVGPGYHGRLVMARGVVEGVARHPAVEAFQAVAAAPYESEQVTVVPYDELAACVSQPDTVWFEPARHYWWRAGMARQLLGARFPIVTMMHSIGYPEQILPLTVSLLTHAQPGDRVIAPGPHAAALLRSHIARLAGFFGLADPEIPIHVVPYGVPDVPDIAPATARRVLGWDTTPVILYVGRLRDGDKADFSSLFRACAQLRASDTAFRLVLAGAGREGLEQDLLTQAASVGLADGLVEIRRNVSDAEKHLLLAACELFVSPSRTVSEAFGLSLVEAMLHAKPVVATAWGGYHDVIDDELTGLLVPTAWTNPENSTLGDLEFLLHVDFQSTEQASSHAAIDVDRLSEQLRRVLRDERLRQTLGQRAKTTARERFLLDTCVSGVVTELRAALDTHAAAPVDDHESRTSLGLLSSFAQLAQRTAPDW